MRLDLISNRGDILPLFDNPYFVLTNVDGMTNASTAISSTTIGGIDGDTVNNVQAQPRSIVFDLWIKNGIDVEAAKRYILSFAKLKQKVSLEWERLGRTVPISGVVEAVDMPRFNNGVTMQITLHCAQPFWEDIDYIVQVINEIINEHYFTDEAADMLYFPEDGISFGTYDTTRTKEFINDGDVSVGLEISIVALATVTNPIIYNESGDYFGVGYGSDIKRLVMESGDIVTITTHKGNKTVKLNGINIFDKIKAGSTWLQLESGKNRFSISSDETSISNMYFNLTFKQRYI